MALYESGASSQILLHGNIEDHFLLKTGGSARLCGLVDYLNQLLLGSFDVVLRYDVGNGIRVERGGEIFSKWPALKDHPELPRDPRGGVEALTRYFRYVANLRRLNRETVSVACLVHHAQLVAPSVPYGFNADLAALASLMREWGTDPLLTEHPLVTLLVSENLNDIHPLLVNQPRVARIKIPLPSDTELAGLLRHLLSTCPVALEPLKKDFDLAAKPLAGVTLSSLEGLVRRKQHGGEALSDADLADLKKDLVEQDCGGLIEFIESKKSLDDLHGLDALKKWLRQDLSLWKRGDVQALPKGYLLCGPVGTGKTYLVECLAGEAGVPVVKLKNFRDKWVGSSEGNLEKIFRLIHALGRCFVFIDEADQTLGRRTAGSDDSGVSGRLYSMMAEEMGSSANRGKIIWILASSRPDLIEVDLKRPGRVDMKIPIFPTATTAESWGLIRALCKKRGLDVPAKPEAALLKLVPDLLTPGAAEVIATKVYRLSRADGVTPIAAMTDALKGYQPAVPLETLWAQIELAVREASDMDFIPERFRPDRKAGKGA